MNAPHDRQPALRWPNCSWSSGSSRLCLPARCRRKPKASATRVAVTARAVTSTLQLARAQAMSSNAETLFRIDVDRRPFRPAEVHAFTAAWNDGRDGRCRDRALRAISGGIRFFPDGQSSGGEIALTLDGRSARIAVNWLTGEPRLIR